MPAIKERKLKYPKSSNEPKVEKVVYLKDFFSFFTLFYLGNSKLFNLSLQFFLWFLQNQELFFPLYNSFSV